MLRNGLAKAGRRSETFVWESVQNTWERLKTAQWKTVNGLRAQKRFGRGLSETMLCSSAEPAMVLLVLDAPTHLQNDGGGGRV